MTSLYPGFYGCLVHPLSPAFVSLSLSISLSLFFPLSLRPSLCHSRSFPLPTSSSVFILSLAEPSLHNWGTGPQHEWARLWSLSAPFLLCLLLQTALNLIRFTGGQYSSSLRTIGAAQGGFAQTVSVLVITTGAA